METWPFLASLQYWMVAKTLAACQSGTIGTRSSSHPLMAKTLPVYVSARPTPGAGAAIYRFIPGIRTGLILQGRNLLVPQVCFGYVVGHPPHNNTHYPVAVGECVVHSLLHGSLGARCVVVQVLDFIEASLTGAKWDLILSNLLVFHPQITFMFVSLLLRSFSSWAQFTRQIQTVHGGYGKGCAWPLDARILNKLQSQAMPRIARMIRYAPHHVGVVWLLRWGFLWRSWTRTLKALLSSIL